MANATSVKYQLDDVKRVYKAKIEELQNNLEITSKAKSAKSEMILMAEAEIESLKARLAESQKMNDMKSLEFNAIMQKMSNEAKGNASSLKCQLNEAKKMHEAEIQTLQKKLEDTVKSGCEAIKRVQKQKVEIEAIQKKLEVATKAELETTKLTKGAEREAANFKSRLGDSQIAFDLKAKELKEETNKSKANATSLQRQFNDEKKRHEAEMQALQKKLEIGTNAELEATKRAKGAESEAVNFKARLGELQKANEMKTRELNTTKEKAKEAEVKLITLKRQFGDSKRRHEAELQQIQKKAE